ncbi:PKD domain-containing protein [bacterium]|nr:PKD domain-containing protein [bacterium]
MRARDDAGQTGTAARFVWTILNEGPVAIDQALEIESGTPTAIVLTATDQDVLSYRVVDGPDHGVLLGVPPTLTYVPDSRFFGTDSIVFKASDGRLDSNEATVTLTVLNPAPTAEAGGPYSVDEGGSVALNGVGTDPNNDPLTYAWDLDNDGTFETPGQDVSFIEVDGPNNVSVSLQVCDDKGNCAVDRATVEVVNVAPTIDLSGAPSAEEGTSYSLTLGAVTDPGQDTVIAWTVNWGDGPGNVNISVDLTDEDGVHVAAGTLAVTVNNGDPVITALTAPSAPVDIQMQPVSVSVAFTDAGAQDRHKVTWDWGDGKPVTVQENVLSPAVAAHVYAGAGVYPVQVTVEDSDGGSTSQIYEYVVVYDPEGGFVTGGGWIYSPAGAYLPEPNLEGKANFGFVSKYKKGANVPSGVTEFQFKTANLSFKSDSYEWLVVAGAKAQYKGNGVVNGVGGYKFFVTAIDADVNTNDAHTADTFRIKIWRDVDGAEELLYDNQIACSNLSTDADPCTGLGGGNIVVHDGKKGNKDQDGDGDSANESNNLYLPTVHGN